jgi:hypothetical protein
MQTRELIRHRVRRITAWAAVGATLAATGLAARAAQADHTNSGGSNSPTTSVEQPTTEDDFGIEQSEQVPSPSEPPSASSDTPDATSGGS